jgi:hypothetical protein
VEFVDPTSLPQGLDGKSQRKNMKTSIAEEAHAVSLGNLISLIAPQPPRQIYLKTKPLPGKRKKRGGVYRWREQSSKGVFSYSVEMLKN